MATSKQLLAGLATLLLCALACAQPGRRGRAGGASAAARTSDIATNDFRMLAQWEQCGGQGERRLGVQPVARDSVGGTIWTQRQSCA
jgi:hypothetical protein